MRLRVTWEVLSLEEDGRGRVLNLSFRTSQAPARPEMLERIGKPAQGHGRKAGQGVWAADRLVNSSDLPEACLSGSPWEQPFKDFGS